MDKLTHGQKQALLKLQKERVDNSDYLVGGEHLAREAHSRGLLLAVYVASGRVYFPDVPHYLTTDQTLKALARTATAPPLVALVKWREVACANPSRILVLDGVSDPGNVGTLIRSALAFSFDCVYSLPGTAHHCSDKVLRSAQGATFEIKVVAASLESLADLRRAGFTLVATAADGALDWPRLEKVAIVVGSEGRGISAPVRDLCDMSLAIAIDSRVESLNAAVAGSLFLSYYGGR